nr:MAG: capsid protein [Pseudoscorpian picorna-like virus 4]
MSTILWKQSLSARRLDKNYVPWARGFLWTILLWNLIARSRTIKFARPPGRKTRCSFLLALEPSSFPFITFTMDIPLPTSAITTTSNVSTWGGRPVQNVDNPEEANRVGEDRTTPDFHDLTKRLFFYPFSSTTTDQSLAISSAQNLTCVSPLLILTSVQTLNNICQLYDSLSYDSITLTCSLSAPKGACGSLYVGYYPFSPWFQTSSLTTEAQRHVSGPPNLTRMLLSPESHLMSISDSQDVRFTIPWTFPTSMLKMPDLPQLDSVGVYGNPIVYIFCDRLSYLSSIVLPPLFKMTVQFNNLRFYGPSYDEVELQSGMEVAIPAVLAGVAETAVAATVGQAFESAREYLDFDPDLDSGYSKPMPVQQAFAGDTTTVGPPLETAIFAPRPFSSPSAHKILDYLKRPQFVQSGTFGASPITIGFGANPGDPIYGTFPNGTDTISTYFRWFSQGAQFWRGTISFYLVIFGHPMVETQHNLIIDYPGANVGLTNADPGNWVTMRGISSGTHCIKIPMPFLNYADALPIYDSLVTTNASTLITEGCSSLLVITLKVISTMLDVSPQIPYTIFMAAEDDFVFLQPYAPGLNNVQQSTELVELQVGIPEVSDTFDTRAIPCAPLPYMLPFIHVEDFMEIWSRSLPNILYDSNDEPIPDPTFMSWPVFWPLSGGSAAWTPDVNNSWYVTNDYISLFSSNYLYYTGSVGVKVICSTSFPDPPLYKYITLLPANLVGRQPANNPFSFMTTDLPFTSNFGNGTTLTPTALQPVLECVLPYRSVLPWNPVTPANLDRGLGQFGGQLPTSAVGNMISTNVVLQDRGDTGDLQDNLFRKKGKDYYLTVEGLLPPGMLWVAKGFDWTA